MSFKEPSIQGISTPPVRTGNTGDAYALRDVEVKSVGSGSGFYTSKVESMPIVATTYTAGTDDNPGSIVFEFSTVSLSEVMVGNYLRVNTCEDHENIGDFRITAVNDGADTITVEALRGKTNASSSGSAETLPFFGGFALECLADTTTLQVTYMDGSGPFSNEMTAGQVRLGRFGTVTTSAGSVEVKLL